MKKIIILLALVFMMIPQMGVYAAVEAPDKPIEVDCPPSYVGQKKCFYVTNPKVKNAKTVSEAKPVPPQKTIKTTAKGKKITNHPYVWAIGLLGGYIVDQSPTAQSAVDGFWNDVNAVDLAAGRIANAMTEIMAEDLQQSWEYAQITGNYVLDLSNDIWNELFGLTKAEMQQQTELREEINNLFKESYTGSAGSVVTDFLNSYGNNYEIYKMYSPYPGEIRLYSVYVYSSRSYFPHYFIYKIYSNGEVEMHRNSIGGVWDKDTREEAIEYIEEWYIKKSNLNDSHLVKPNADSLSALGVPSAMGTVAPVVPNYSQGIPKIKELGGTKYYETPNKTSPAHPNLQPVGGGSKIPGHVIIDQGGNEIDKNGNKPNKPPITAPVDKPLEEGEPGYEKPTPPGEKEPDEDFPKPEDESNRFSNLFTKQFPFSLPWDVAYLVGLLAAEPKAPVFEMDKDLEIMDISVPFKFKHTVEWADPYLPFFRTMIVIGYIFFLIFATSKLFGGAK